MILILESGMLSVFYRLIISLQLHFRIEKTVLVNVLFVLDLFLAGQLGYRCLMLLLQFRHSLLIVFLGENLFLLAACKHCLVILVKVRLQIAFCVGNQFCDLILILIFHSLGLFKLGLQPCNFLVLFLLRKDMILLYAVNIILKLDHPVGSVCSETVELGLDFSYIILNRLAELFLLFSRKNAIFLCHIPFPRYRYFALSLSSSS